MRRKSLLRGGKKLAPRKPKFVAEAPVTSRLDDNKTVVGIAKIEQLPGGSLIAHIDASGLSAEQLRRGLSVGSFTVPEEKDAPDPTTHIQVGVQP